ncbi:hypothetical protein L7F22_005534 [Adiantum nelumboides]|nr:hypothetical protein [Adiantum nelumboides]
MSMQKHSKEGPPYAARVVDGALKMAAPGVRVVKKAFRSHNCKNVYSRNPQVNEPRGYTVACSRSGTEDTTVWLRQSRLARSNAFGSALRPRKALKGLTRTINRGVCRSELLQDAPFVAAIGACILSSLVLQKKEEDQSSSAPLGEDDVRNGAVTVISFIPLFNWLGWVFKWLDTKDQRYLLYASVYLAPYVRTGFSLSSDENWLLILSYFACIAHVQLEINSLSVGGESGKTSFQDGFWNLRQKVNPELPGKQSRNSHDSLRTDHENSNAAVEEDFSQIELSEFDKKLSGMRGGEVDESSESSEKRSKKAEVFDD